MAKVFVSGCTPELETVALDIVFLDSDGVLVTERSAFRRSVTGIAADPDAIAALNWLVVAQAVAQLVITSTWRRGYTLPELAERLISTDFETCLTMEPRHAGALFEIPACTLTI